MAEFKDYTGGFGIGIAKSKKIPRLKPGDRKLTALSASLMNRLIDLANGLIELEVKRGGKEEKLFIADGNMVLQLRKQGTSDSPPTPGVSVSQFKLKKLFGDYLQCLSATDEARLALLTPPYPFVSIAKPPLLVNSLTSRTLDGVAITYSYTSSGAYDTVERTASGSGFNTETHRVIPHYLAAGLNVDGSPKAGGDDIFAASCSLTVAGTAFSWIDLNCDGRVWSEIPVNPPP